MAETRFALARLLWEQRQDRPRARRLAEQAQQAYAEAGIVDHTEEVATWLATRS